MQDNRTDLLNEVANYYSSKLAEHGESPRGVDWNSEESQTLRFAQLAKILTQETSALFSVNDLGCGYGALLDYLCNHHEHFTYAGIETMSKLEQRPKTELIEAANKMGIKHAEPDFLDRIYRRQRPARDNTYVGIRTR